VKFESAALVSAGSVLNTDVCVIGSGAAGVTLARELDGSGLDVLLLEAGGIQQDAEIEAETFAVDHRGVHYANPLPSRGRWYGGSTNLWVGRIAMLGPMDFEARSWVPHSGWPIARDALWPWAQRAADILAVPAFHRIDIETWSSHPAVERIVKQAGANLEVFVWADGLYMGPFNRDRLLSSPNVRVLLDATATELVPNESSTTIEELTVSGPSGSRFTVRARRFVLAAGGLENPRLLLASTRRSAAGIGNARDQVGRYYMDHPRCEGLATVDLRTLSQAELTWLRMLGDHREQTGRVQFRLLFSEQMQRREQLLNHGLHADFASDIHGSAGYQSVQQLLQRLRSRQLRPDAALSGELLAFARGAPELAAYAVQKLRGRSRPSRMYLIDQMEQEPDPESRVTVNPSRRDRWGLPRLELDWRVGESTFRSQRRMHQLFKEILARSGIHTFQSALLDDPAHVPTVMEMKHPTGTTRMSTNASHGVVDTNCRVHGLANLYIAGSSVFPTVGHANPTLTIVALAARLADHLRGAPADA
jgi:choline dehydrogenase-like flavoprotein